MVVDHDDKLFAESAWVAFMSPASCTAAPVILSSQFEINQSKYRVTDTLVFRPGVLCGGRGRDVRFFGLVLAPDFEDLETLI